MDKRRAKHQKMHLGQISISLDFEPEYQKIKNNNSNPKVGEKQTNTK